MATVLLPMLKECRRKMGWDIPTLAATARVGKGLVTQAERDKGVGTGTARKFAAALGVSVEFLRGQKSFLDLIF